MPKFGKTSKTRMDGLHPDLIKVLNGAIKISKQDFLILEGVRSKETMAANYGKGRSYKQCLAAGIPQGWAAKYAKPQARKVTWLKNPFASKHRVADDGYGHAVDVAPYPIDWNDTAKYDAIADAMFAAAEKADVDIRWGADWDRDGIPRERGEYDAVHFELV